MEKGGGGDGQAARAAGGMCDRLLTFLAKNLSMNRHKAITDAPRNGAAGGGGGQRQKEGGEEEEEDEFAIRIERTEFEFFGGDGEDSHGGGVATVLEDVSTAAAPAANGEQREKGAAVDRPAVATAVAGETKVRKTVTIKEDRPEEGAAAPALERKKSLFKKRQAAAASGGEGGGDAEQGGRPVRRSGLRPRMPAVPRVPSNINERSSTFIEERKRSFRGSGKPAPDR
ncbi:hypothetical protein ACP70R_008017 [Stipagrostis hirtigluma subsp. patula]